MTSPESSSRQLILARIAAALGRDAAAAASVAPADYAALPRDYHAATADQPAQRIQRFLDRLHEYNAECTRVGSASEIAPAIAATLTARSQSPHAEVPLASAALAVASGIPPAWLPAGFDFPLADPLTLAELDRQPGILTTCTVAIAETGSLVLQSAPSQGLRRHTLVPDFHLCVVFESQLVSTVPEAFARLDPDLPTTFISGPSATAAIEMTRIKGVHGPRSLYVLLVAD